MVIDRARTARGALAGAIAAGVWALQQPLDQRVFGVDYDDTELLGGLVTHGPRGPAVGMAMHLANGAAFGAVYAGVMRQLPLPAWARGPAAALTEHLASWPLATFSDRIPGGRRAFAQATWRHLLFGVLLGELERRLNRDGDERDGYEHLVSSNGHGDIEHAIIGAEG
jgi:hypothetical protein